MVPVVLLRTVLEEAASLLRLLSWLRQWGSGWACKALKDMEPMGWQDTERGHTGMARVLNKVWMDRAGARMYGMWGRGLNKKREHRRR